MRITTNHTQLRYYLRDDKEETYLYEDKALLIRKHMICNRDINNRIYVDILESIYDGEHKAMRVKLYYSNGVTVEGWILHNTITSDIAIENANLLYDGRFNS